MDNKSDGNNSSHINNKREEGNEKDQYEKVVQIKSWTSSLSYLQRKGPKTAATASPLVFVEKVAWEWCP